VLRQKNHAASYATGHKGLLQFSPMPGDYSFALIGKRPTSVTILAGLYIAVGAIGFVYHFRESLASPRGGMWVELTELLAFISGVFILRRQNWARWLAVAWIAFHVILSAFDSLLQSAIHAVFLVVIAWVLFRSQARWYFRGARMEPK
jgi:hypothetical protein